MTDGRSPSDNREPGWDNRAGARAPAEHAQRTREKVVIVGGGVAGLSAAHELMERGFEVHVYERRGFFGGKAASYRVPKPATLGHATASAQPETDPPGEHGFRFFPGWYRHLIDTMTRIPYHRAKGGRRSVADNLVSVRSNLLCWFDRAPIALPLRVPSNVSDAVAISNFVSEFSALGITAGEVALLVRKLAEFLMLPDEKRVQAFDHITWWDYLECAKPGRSRAYQDFVRATTRTMVAAKAEQVSAYTIGRLAIRTLLDTLSTLDRVLNGPTAEVWIDPWIAHLEARGVRFHRHMELQSIGFDRQSRKVKQLGFESIAVAHLRRLRRRISECLRAEFEEIGVDYVTEAADALAGSTDNRAWQEAAERAKQLLGRACETHSRRKGLEQQRAQARQLDAWPPDAADRDVSREPLQANDDALVQARQQFMRHRDELIQLEMRLASYEQQESGSAALQAVDATYYILALPLEQLAYYVNRTSMLTFLAPELRDVISLSRSMDWMAGIQFYFERPLDIAPGHLVGLDSDWALTAIEQTQFWDDVTLPSNVRSILSVDISAWNKKGRRVRKEAYNCDADEIAREVWAQLSEMLNRPNRFDVLREDMLVGGRLQRGVSYHLDDTIVERYDRKKQAAYERARGLDFSAIGAPGADPTPDDKEVDGFMWGPRRLFNAEPLLINRTGTREKRPGACTSIANLFIAADYVKTETDLACMEGANEAARRAVNGILEAASSREPRCELWPFSAPRQAVEAVLAIAAPMQAVRSVTNVVARWQDVLFKNLGARP